MVQKEKIWIIVLPEQKKHLAGEKCSCFLTPKNFLHSHKETVEHKPSISLEALKFSFVTGSKKRAITLSDTNLDWFSDKDELMNHFAPKLWHLLIAVCSSHRYHPTDAFGMLPSFLPGLGLAGQNKAYSKTFVIQIHPFKYDTERLRALLNNIKLWHKKITESKYQNVSESTFSTLYETRWGKKILLLFFATFFIFVSFLQSWSINLWFMKAG